MNDSALLYNDCSFSGGAVLPNTTGNAVCGLPVSYANNESNNNTAFRACCGEIRNYGCSVYCPYSQGLQSFTNCLSDHGARNGTVLNAFCQSGVIGTKTLPPPALPPSASPTSAEDRRRPSIWVTTMLLVFFLVFYIAPTSAAIINELCNDQRPIARQSDAGSCAFTQEANYTTVRNSQKVSDDHLCSSGSFCTYTYDVATSITANNRTINGSSAAGGEYINFFRVLGDTTGRDFPAMFSMQMRYLWSVDVGSGGYLGWTPYAWCVNGTVANCAAELGGANDTTPIEVCGAIFTTDPQTDPNAIIQGVILPVQTS